MIATVPISYLISAGEARLEFRVFVAFRFVLDNSLELLGMAASAFELAAIGFVLYWHTIVGVIWQLLDTRSHCTFLSAGRLLVPRKRISRHPYPNSM